jgi:hypothetical protein
MAETQSSSLSGTIYASIIDQGILAYQYDRVVVADKFRFRSLADDASDTARFPRWVKSTGPATGTPTDEVTALATTALTTTSATVAVSRVGIARELTETAKEDSVVGRSLYVQGFIMDAAQLYGEYFDTTATALHSSITATKGTSGAALSISTMVDVIGAQRSAKCRGENVIALHDHQLKQLQQAQVAASSTGWPAFYSPNGAGGEYGGVFMGCEIWASGLCPTSTGDRLGAIWSMDPEYAYAAYVVKRAPSSLTQTNVLMDSNIWASFARVGFGIIANNFATSIRSVNA